MHFHGRGQLSPHGHQRGSGRVISAGAIVGGYGGREGADTDRLSHGDADTTLPTILLASALGLRLHTGLASGH
jgi:hypothetical protein